MKGGKRKVILEIVAVSFFAFSAFAQNERTDVFEEEAKRVAYAFANDMQHGKDVAKLLPKYAIRNYGWWMPNSNEFAEAAFLSPKLLSETDQQRLLRLHLASFNFYYLESIWDLFRKDQPHDLPEIKKIFDGDPYLASFVDDSISERQLTSHKELSQLIDRLEQASKIYRDYLREFPDRKNEHYSKSLAEFKNTRNFQYSPELHVCKWKRGCFGISRGKKFILVGIEPCNQVALTKVAGKMKIISLLPCMY